jgi:hypothetical protein
MILDMALDEPLLVLPLFLIGLCLIIYGKEILEVLSFPIGAISGGILAYMILRGFLAPYEVPIIIEVVVAFVMVLIGGIMGPGTMVMVVTVIISMALVDLMNVLLGEGNEVISWIVGALFFAVMIYPVQRFLTFSSAICGAVLVAMGSFIILEPIDPVPRMVIQVVMIMVLGTGGGFFQTWMKKRMDRNNDESVWIPTGS